MSTLTEDVQSAVRGASCWLADSLFDNPDVGNSLIFRDFRRVPGGETARDYWASRTRQLRNFICNDGPRNGAEVPEEPDGFPFEGGQCPTDYDINVVYFYDSGFFGDRRSREITARRAGPISNVRLVQGDNLIQIFATNESGEIQIDALGESLGDVSGGAIAFVEVTRVDGQADDCGNVPPAIPTGPVWRYPVPNPENPDNPGIDIDVSLPVIIIGPGGELSFNFGVQIGALNLSFVYSPGAGDPAPNPSQDPNDCCPDKDTGGEQAPPTDGDPDEPPSELRFDSAICSVVNLPNVPGGATEKGDGIGPSIFLPSLAEIRFAVSTPGGNAWTQALKIQGLKEVIQVPVRYPAFAWSVDEYQGVSVVVTPLYNREEPTLEES